MLINSIKEYCCDYVKEKDDDEMDLSESKLIINKDHLEDLIDDYRVKTECMDCFIKSYCRRQCKLRGIIPLSLSPCDIECKEIIMQYIKEEEKK